MTDFAFSKKTKLTDMLTNQMGSQSQSYGVMPTADDSERNS